jgi:hypothetical protein
MDVQNLPKSLPEMETTFEIDVEGNLTKQRFQGNFTYRIPNMRARALADKERARMNEGLERGMDETVAEMHSMISYLRHTLTAVPPWWKESSQGYDLFDANVVTAIYIKAMQFEKEWMEQVWGKKSEEGAEK